jgi:hypothetical protein
MERAFLTASSSSTNKIREGLLMQEACHQPEMKRLR